MAFVTCFLPKQLHTSTFSSPSVNSLSSPASSQTSSRHVAPRCVAPSTSARTNTLGSSDLVVTDVCLGTMTWGVQNTEAEAQAQLDYALLERGINFLDTAEVYPVPQQVPNHEPGATERYIGNWLAKNRSQRDRLVIATKVSGFSPSSRTAGMREMPPRTKEPFPDARLDAANIRAACDASLRRLQTDYIDLYQLHWPDRYVPIFGRRAYNLESEREGSIELRESLLGLKELLDVGKIRSYGLSNETAFGVCEIVRLADELGMPRPATIQNSFCLLDRKFEADLAEACAPRNFNIGLLPWSILCGGVLTGKYNGKIDREAGTADDSLSKCRFVLFKAFQGRFTGEEALQATLKYSRLARENGMSVATLAQAFCKSRWYIPSSIIGATSVEQLKENIDAFEVDLSEDVLNAIDEIHNGNKDPIVAA